MFGDVIVPIDGSALAAQALDVGATVARANGSRLRAVAFTRKSDDLLFDLWVHEQVGEIGRNFGLKPDLRIRTVEGDIDAEILSELESHPGALICMGSHGWNRIAAITGSVTSKLLEHTTMPVLVCGPSCLQGTFAERMHGPTVVALDGSPESEAILPVAEAWSIVFDTLIDIVSVVPPEPVPALGSMIASGDVLESGYVEHIAAKVAALTTRETTFDVLHDDHPADALVAEVHSRNAALVAMTTSAPHGLDRLLHGSVASQVIHDSPVPVLVLRPIDTSADDTSH